MGAGRITRGAAEAAWNAFHDAKNSDELAQDLPPDLPNDVKHELFSAKRLYDSQPSAVEKVVDAIHRVEALNGAARETAEKHSVVSRLLVEAALKEKSDVV